MGLRELFGGGGGGGRGGRGKLAKLIKTTINPYTQSAERYHAMEQLFGIAAKDEAQAREAYVGILRRFTIASTKSIEDEEEKGWAYRRLSAIGKPLLPALGEFCLEHENVAWALRILEDIANEEEEWELLERLLEAHPPGYMRDPSKKVQMLTHLAEIDSPRVTEILARYLEDDDETVRFFCVEQLVDIADESAKDALVARLGNEEEDSLRLRTRILDGLAELAWDVSEHEAVVTKNLGSEHGYSNGTIVRA